VYKKCIRTIEFFLSSTNKGAVGFIPAQELAILTRTLLITPATSQTTYFNDWIARRRVRVDYKRDRRALEHLSH